jgi:hypothetical protein
MQYPKTDRSKKENLTLPDENNSTTKTPNRSNVFALDDTRSYSHALLGIFDAIAPAASAALHALDAGNIEQYKAILAPTVPLSRHIFQAPTYHYKTGIVFLAYLNGHQDHFRMVGNQETARSIAHLARLFVLADQAHLLHDPERASERMYTTLVQAGIEQTGGQY